MASLTGSSTNLLQLFSFLDGLNAGDKVSTFDSGGTGHGGDGHSGPGHLLVEHRLLQVAQ